jgi:endo-1,4-beta-mannosidase
MDYNLQKGRLEESSWESLELMKAAITERLELHKQLGINCIRISMNQYRWFYGGDYGVTPEQYQAQLDWVVRECQRLGIYVYFCFHHGSSAANAEQQALMDNHNADLWNTGVGWLDWVKMLAGRWKEYTAMIGFQIWAEPAWGTETDYEVLMQKWSAFSLANARAIHSINPNALVFVVGAGYYAHKEVPDYYVDNPLPEPNIVYAWQDYYMHQSDLISAYNTQNYTYARQKMEEWFINKAFKMNFAPTMLTEFGFSKSRPTQDWNVELHAIQDWYDIQRKYQQSWTQWVWWTSNQDLGLLESDWRTLTETGQLVVQNLA